MLEKYEYDLSLCRVLKGSEKRKRNSLEVSGGEIVLSIEPDNELMKAKTLNLLELEGAVNQDVEIQVFMIPKGINPPGREGQWYGNFILQKYVPLFSAKKYQRITLDLSHRFVWEKKTIERLTIKITPVEDKECRIKIKGLRMLSHSSYLVEKIPSMGYYRYGGADRNRLKSVFLPVGSDISDSFVC